MNSLKERWERLVASEKQNKEERKAILEESIAASEEDKVQSDHDSRMELFLVKREFEYPITVNAIVWAGAEWMRKGWRHQDREDGQTIFVRVRPCSKRFDEKTYLGIYIADVAMGFCSQHHPNTGVLALSPSFYNPLIWIPDLQEVVLGAGSWWGEIKSPADLEKISDLDIESVWYVRCLKALSEAKPEPEEDEE